MPISYKNKIYTTLGTPTVVSGNGTFVTNSAGVPAKDYAVKGKTIVWNQLFTNSATSSNGVNISQNQDGTMTLNGTATATYINFTNLSDAMNQVHKYLLCLKILNNPDNVSFHYGWLNRGVNTGIISNGESCSICNQTETMTQGGKYTGLAGFETGTVFNNVKVAVMVMDLTQMFGAGNEPATVAEFRAMFPDDYYPYNAGELKSVVPMSVETSTAERFQLLDKSKFTATTTINGVTFTNNGDGTITYNGTTTGANYTLQSGLRVIAGHKYFSYVGENTNNKISVLLYADPDPYNTFDERFPKAEGGISTALKNCDRLYYQPKPRQNISYSNFILKPQFFDLTEMFGAGNEPTTPAEFWQRVPEKLYGYNPSAYKSVNIPSSKYFPDGMRSAGSVYDEINFLSQKAIKRVGVRPYQAGDENNTGFITDKKNTVYALATPVETPITPPLQALQTFKGFTSFSAPNSLMQNGPLSVTYYAEGGSSPEKGWLTSYKRKLYMGRNIEWNQLLDKSKFRATVTSGGITVRNNGDGTFTINGTKEEGGGTTWIWFYNSTENVSLAKKLYGHKILYGCVQNPSSGSTNNTWGIDYEINNNMTNGAYTRSNLGESAVIATLNKVAASDITKAEFHFYFRPSSSGPAVYKDVVVRPQIFDLTQMFGAGNEPATPEEFWSYFDYKLYPYNPGETQPLFKISRKSQWGSLML